MIVALMYVRATGLAHGEKKIGCLAGLAVDHRRLHWTHRLPRFYAAAKKGIDRLGECHAGLVDGDIEQAYR
jgi:hypothetical protein